MKTLVKQSKSLAQGVKSYIIADIKVYSAADLPGKIFILSFYLLISAVLYNILRVIIIM